MQLNAQFDQESSIISQKIIFTCEDFELRREDITELKKKKYITYVEEKTLPELIPCQVLIFLENMKARVIFFNQDFTLPPEAQEESFLNKDLLERWATNGGFRMEFILPLSDKGVKLNLSYTID
ncbi:MAG: hypothetical protein WC875_02345 [Candidatus Absconditabacterales bacterium]